jgi:hypothetical protein
MTVEIEEIIDEPVSITQGETVVWEKEIADYTSTDWTLTYHIAGPSVITVTGVADGSGWECTITATESAALEPGAYLWQSAVSATVDGVLLRKVISTGQLEVVADLAAAPSSYLSHDPRTSSKKSLESINELLENPAALRKMDPDKLTALYELKKQLTWDVKRENDAEKAARGGQPTNKIYVRFTRA